MKKALIYRFLFAIYTMIEIVRLSLANFWTKSARRKGISPRFIPL